MNAFTFTPPPGELTPADPLTAPTSGPLLAYRGYDYGPYPFIIPELLPVGVALLWGPPGRGKSVLAIQLEMTIACDRSIASWRPGESGPVLVVDYEMGFRHTLETTRRIAEYMMLPADEETDEGRQLRKLIDYRDGVPGATLLDRMAELTRWLEEARAADRPYKLVRVDTLALFMGPAPAGFNAYEWASYVVGALNKLALDYECCIVVVHHPNKQGEISGSVGIEGKATISWKLERESGEQEGALRCSKNRVGPEKSHELYFDTDRGVWEFGQPVTAGQLATTGIRRQILDLLAEHGPMDGRTLRGMMPEVKVQTGKDAMGYLRGKGWISRSPDGMWSLVRPAERTAPASVPVPEGDIDPGPASTPTETPVISQSQEAEYPFEVGGYVTHPEMRAADAAPWPPAEEDGERCQVCGEMVTGADGHPDCVPAPEGAKRWDSFGALRRTLESSRMHPMWFVPRAERDAGAWPAAILADKAAEAGYRWTAPGLDTLDPATLVAPLDRSQSFTTACSSVPLAAGKLHHTGPMDFDPKDKEHSEHGVAGVALVVVPDGIEGMPHPLGRRAVPGEEMWIPTGRLETLWKLYADGLIGRPVVLDSYTGRRTVGLLDGYAAAVRDARAEFAGDPEMTAAVKRSASTALRCLYPTSAKSPWWRPDWRAAVVGEAGDRLWMVAHRAVKAGAMLAGMGNVDQVAYLVPSEVGDAIEFVPDGYKLGRDPGTYHAGTTRVRTGTDLSVAGRSAPDPARVEVGEKVIAITGPLSLGVWLARRA